MSRKSKKKEVLEVFFQLRKRKKIVTAKEVSETGVASIEVCWRWLSQTEEYMKDLPEIRSKYRCKNAQEKRKVVNVQTKNGKIIQKFPSLKVASKCTGTSYYCVKRVGVKDDDWLFYRCN